MTLTQAAAAIGRSVVYVMPGGERRRDYGVITSVNNHYVFVRYLNQHPSAPGQATPASHLDLL